MKCRSILALLLAVFTMDAFSQAAFAHPFGGGGSSMNNPIYWQPYFLPLLLVTGLWTGYTLRFFRKLFRKDYSTAQMTALFPLLAGVSWLLWNGLYISAIPALAELGWTQAQMAMGAALLDMDTGAEPAGAISWYEKAARHGNAEAMYKFHGSTGNEYSYLESSATLGYVPAMVELAHCYEEGEYCGLPLDEVKAQQWYRKAAEAGESESALKLGNMYEYGWGGVTKDTEQAAAWYAKSNSLEGYSGWKRTSATHALPEGWEKEDMIPGELTPEDFLLAKHSDSRSYFFSLALSAYTIHSNLSEARKWLEKAVNAGDEDAIGLMAEAYRNGSWRFPRDKEMAGKYYLLSQHSSYIDVQHELGNMYEYGWGGVVKDQEKACFFYSKASISWRNMFAEQRTCPARPVTQQ